MTSSYSSEECENSLYKESYTLWLKVWNAPKNLHPTTSMVSTLLGRTNISGYFPKADVRHAVVLRGNKSVRRSQSAALSNTA